eukprot:Platyproteum_vivax@DN6109_c0_g1_i1.p1
MGNKCTSCGYCVDDKVEQVVTSEGDEEELVGLERSDGAFCIGDINLPIGKIRYPNEDEYFGEWKNGVAEGVGKINRPAEGSTYEGEFVQDLPEGHGIEHYADDSRYEGSYKDGMKNGQGTFRWANGTEYAGMFQDNVFNGKGRYKWADAREYLGEWQQNQFHGFGRMTWPDGRCYEGNYSHDKKNGHGSFTWPDGRKYVGSWRDGKQHGNGEFTTNGNTRKGMWVNGTRVKWLDDGSK